MSDNNRPRKPGEILAAGFLPDDAMSALEAHYTVHHYYRADDPAALLQEVADDIVCMVGTSHALMSAELINALPNLQQISVYGTGWIRSSADRNLGTCKTSSGRLVPAHCQ